MEIMSELNGIWQHGRELIVFGDDVLVIGQCCYSWKDEGERLFILPAEAKIVVPYRCDGDTLRLDVDGVVSFWTRVHDV